MQVDQEDKETAIKRVHAILYMIVIFIVIIGAINWGVIGIYGVNIVSEFNKVTFKNLTCERIMYAIIGLAGLLLLFNRNTYLPFLGVTVLPSVSLKPYNTYNDQELVINAAGASKVVYWAAHSEGDNKVYNNPYDAYGKGENSGVAEVNSDGTAVLKFKCPGKYQVGHVLNKILPKHIHYRLVYDDNTLSEIKTIKLNC
jgi:hypothetical protein